MTVSDNVRSAVTDDGIVLMDVSNGRVFHSNPVGSRVWVKLQEGLPMSSIIDAVAAEFGAPRSEVEADVSQYIESLKTKGLIQG
jgi:Coenzyme PQQ synthesis protein D (PqqD)